MKEKLIVGIIAVLVLIAALCTSIIINNSVNNQEKYQSRKIAQDPVSDECTEEYEISIQTGEIQEANSSENKISSNSALILKKYYKDCGHTISEYAEMMPELVNMTQDEVEEKFIGWELIGFNAKEVILFKEFEGECGEHFKLKEEKGKVIVYKILDDKSEQIYEKTEISTEYLPESDLLQIQSENGIDVVGIEELHKMLEDFE